MAVRRPEPERFPWDRDSRRDRDWRLVIVGVSLVAMLVFEMFHSPPCNPSWSGCSASDFLARVGINAIWGTVIGVAAGIALAAIIGMFVDALAARRTTMSIAPLIRIATATAAGLAVLILVLVRYQFVAS